MRRKPIAYIVVDGDYKSERLTLLQATMMALSTGGVVIPVYKNGDRP